MNYEQKYNNLLSEITAVVEGCPDTVMDLAGIIDRAAELDADTALLLSSGYVYRDDETLQIHMGDVWGWALAYCREIPVAKIKEVADLYRRWGWPGLLYWETTQPDGFTKSEFKDNNRFIAFVKAEEDQILKVPDSNKRAYAKLAAPLVLE